MLIYTIYYFTNLFAENTYARICDLIIRYDFLAFDSIYNAAQMNINHWMMDWFDVLIADDFVRHETYEHRLNIILQEEICGGDTT